MTQNFAIRTITIGLDIVDLRDTEKILHAIRFLKKSKNSFENNGFVVQTIRISTPHLHQLSKGLTDSEVKRRLVEIDQLTHEDNIFFSVGELAPTDVYDKKYVELARDIIDQTKNIHISIRVSHYDRGIFYKSIHLASEIILAIAHSTSRGEGNFRFAAAANCRPHIPFFPVAYHLGPPGFSIGIEFANILLPAIQSNDWERNKESIRSTLNSAFYPIEKIAERISEETNLLFFGIDTSTVPGLNASIGAVIEKLTGRPFGHSSTLSACSLITDVIKNVDVKTCGYSGLMLPVLEDQILAKRVMEGNCTVNDILMCSAVSGTGLDVIPLPGNISIEQLQGIIMDVASLSVKYASKSMSARLFVIPGSKAGDLVRFENPYLTDCKVLNVH